MEIKDILEKLKRNDISSSEAKRQIQQILSNKKNDFSPHDTLTTSDELSIEDVYKYVLEITATVLKFETSQIRLKEPLDSYGIDSIISVRLANAFEVDLGTLSKMLFFEYKNLEEVSQYFHQTFPEQLKARIVKEKISLKSSSPLNKTSAVIVKKDISPVTQPLLNAISNDDSDDIAIIGLSGKYPKSPNLEIFWENLKAGFNGIDKIPVERWDYREFYDSQKSRHGTMCTNLGGFIDGVDEFDDLLFKILPIEAKILDPQDRLFLQSVWESIEDAGYTRESIVKRTQGEVGVYVGIMTGDYSLLSAKNAGKETNIFSNGISAEVANRTSYFFDFQGPSITLNTMCSSSLTALSLAYDSLKQGRIQLAIVGGVNLSLHPNKFLVLSDNNFLSKDGLCRSFGAGGSGYIPSEGCGSAILKPLKQAIEDRDHIYGVIKSVAVNNCGRSNRYRVPMAKAQAKVIDQALSEANIHPRTISYIEAHGTGTELGDPVEIDGLNQAFSKSTLDKQFCSIGSVKSNMGHSEGAAGIASLTKVLLQMQHKTLVPSIHVEKPNPNIQFEKTPFYVQQICEPWKKMTLIEEGKEKKYPRRAGVSSFGAGGTNVHVILEEYEQKTLAFEHSPLQNLFVLSAASSKQLKQYALKMKLFLIKRRSHPDYLSEIDFQARFAYTLQVGRQSMNYRLAIVFSDLDQLVTTLSSFASDVDSQYMYGEIDQKQVYMDATYDINHFSIEILKKDWITGKTILWENLWPSSHPRRLSLPTYLFQKRKFWISDDLPTFSEKIYDSPKDEKKSEEPLLFAIPVWSKEIVPQKQDQTLSLEEIGEKILLYPANYHSMMSSIQLGEDMKEMIELPTYQSGEDVLTGLHFISSLMQKIMKEKRYARATFLVLLEESDFWKYAYLKGFFLSLIQEQPKFRMKILLLPSIMKIDLKSILGKEWLNADQIVSYHSHERSCLTYQSIQHDEKFHGSVVKEGGVYWITGGVGGLGRLFATYFGKQNKKLTLILSGRSPLTDEQFQSLKDIVGTNVSLIYEKCDVSHKNSVSYTLDKIINSYSKIDGIIHSAGVIRDSLLIRKNLDHLPDVINPKVLGIINLDDATKDLPLDYLLFFSSESGAFGNVGQTDYAAANAFMDAFSMRRNQLRELGQRSGKTVSINWPLWKEGGMSVPEHVEKEIFDLTGMIPLESTSGTESLDFMLSVNTSQIVIAQGNVEKIKEVYSIDSYYSEGDWVKTLNSIAEKDLLKEEQPLPRIDVSSDPDFIMIRKNVKELFSQVSQIAHADINEDVDFQDYGADSVIFSELANAFSKKFEVEFTPSFFFTHTNLKEVALATYQLLRREKPVISSVISSVRNALATADLNSELIEVIGEEHKTYRMDLTGEEVFFRDHLLNSKKLFPAAMYLELIARVGKKVLGEEIVIEKCVFDKPLFFDFMTISLFITLIQNENSSIVNVWVSSTSGEKIDLAVGKISIAQNNKEKTTKVNISNISIHSLSDKFIYEELASIGLEYKQAFRSIKKINIYEEYIFSNLRLPKDVRLEDEIFPYPFIDGAFQSIIGFVKNGQETSPEIPYRVKGLRKYREFQESVNVLIKKKCVNVLIKQKETFIYTLEFYDEEGYLIAVCDEFETAPFIKKVTIKKSTCMDQLIQMISKITTLPFDAINPSLPLTQFALGNFEFVQLQRELEAYFLIPIPYALFRNNENLDELAQKLDRMTSKKTPDRLEEEIALSSEIFHMTDEEAIECLNKELLLK